MTNKYEVTFKFRDQQGKLMKGTHVVEASSSLSAIQQTKADNSWKCNNMTNFSTKKTD